MSMIRPLAGLGLFISLMLMVQPSQAEKEIIPGPVPARVVRVLDGDTIEVRARIWLGQDVETRVRLAGINAPELHGQPCETADGARAKHFLQARLPESDEITLHDVTHDKYAKRVVAQVLSAGGENMSTALLRAGLAHPYDGRAKSPWCR